MPHDVNGTLLKVGDQVLIRGYVTEIYPNENYCNCTVRLDHNMPPDNQATTISSINTRQIEKVNGDSTPTD